MGIKKKAYSQPSKKFSAQRASENSCKAENLFILFSFKNITSNQKYNFYHFKRLNGDAQCAINKFWDKLKVISSKTWIELDCVQKKSSYERMSAEMFPQDFLNTIDYKKGEKFLVFRFNSQRCRFVARRGSKCDRVLHILGIDFSLSMYKH